jgi:nitroimidazol reductase NimA-like FMN-containing flavoprotein (pyridoxamine 5'-phosphate oxidase superfamily)
MKIISATSEIPNMTGEEAEKFLQSKLNLQLATIDEQGNPNIQPVWFYYDKNGALLPNSNYLAGIKQFIVLDD